jgi:hypothetical protein
LYDFKANEEMALSMVKEQLNHFKIKKVIDEESKDPLTWWIIHDVCFSYLGFMA